MTWNNKKMKMLINSRFSGYFICKKKLDNRIFLCFNQPMTPKEYIKTIRKTTIAQVAKELDCTRQHLSLTLNERQPWSRNLAERFEKWSDGLFAKERLMWP